MKYAEIRKLLEDNNLDCSIDLEIASCVSATIKGMGTKPTNKTYIAMCNCVRKVWDNIDYPCTQKIADIVADNVYNCYEYWNRKPMVVKDLMDNIGEIVEQYYAHVID